ncbi:MAG: nuclear transport factor 2 family protein [Rhodococcus qingshengii]|jgi:hypothetical protein
MEEIWRKVADRNEIHDVLMKYCRGVDRCEEDSLKSVYYSDSHYDHYPLGDQRAQRSRRWQRTLQELRHGNRGSTRPTVIDLTGARYLDRLTRRDGDWRIAERTVVLVRPWRRLLMSVTNRGTSGKLVVTL